MDRAPNHAKSTRRRRGLAGAPHCSANRKPVLAPARRALLALLTASFLAVCAPSASAVIVHLQGGQTLSYQPLRGARPALGLDEFFSNLDYNGGPVMTSNTNYAFYWQPAGAPAYPAEYQSGVNQYFEALAHDSGGHENVDSVSTQYNDAAGGFASYDSHFAGAIIDTDPYPANGCTRAAICITDAQIQAELSSYIAKHGLPQDLAHEYFLLTPPGVEDCFEASGRECSAGSSEPVYCAYHSNIPVGASEIVYANDPYVTGIEGCDDGNHPNGKPSDGALEGGLVHEHNESITDPEPNNAWTDIGGSGGEIGDKCEENMGTPLGTAPDGASYNQVIDGHFYWYQEMWSNQSHKCLQRLTLSGEQPTATFTSTQGPGKEVSFDATGSSAPGGVARYNWQFNDGPGGSLSVPTETTSPTVTHRFKGKGPFIVALTVFAADGTSIGTARTVAVGKPPAPTIMEVSPNGGPKAGGTSVTIAGSGFALGAIATSFKFGKRLATSVDCTTSASCTVVAPAAAKAGTVDVIALVGKAKSRKSRPADAFTYS
ncbi:MAG: PKD domain-containing protein [Solirubrobacteraceae bacterium]